MRYLNALLKGLKKQDSKTGLVVYLALNPEHSAELPGSEIWGSKSFY